MADKNQLPISVPHDPQYQAELERILHPNAPHPDRTVGDTAKWQRRRSK